MESKNSMRLLLFGVSVILGVAIFKQIDFEQLTFKKPALVIVYIMTFVYSGFFIVKRTKKTSNKANGYDEL